MEIESKLPFPVNRMYGAAAHAGHLVVEHYGHSHAIDNADQAMTEIAQLRNEEPTFIEPIPRLFQPDRRFVR